jgi:hypothetical protein
MIRKFCVCKRGSPDNLPAGRCIRWGIHEVIQKARPQFQAHGHLVSIKNTSSTAGYATSLLVCGYEATTDNDPMAKLTEQAVGDSHRV